MPASPAPWRVKSTTAPRSCHPRCKCRCHRVVIAERQGTVADDLTGLMALAGDQQGIAGLQAGNRGSDRLGAIADLVGALGRTQYGGADRLRIFAARVV